MRGWMLWPELAWPASGLGRGNYPRGAKGISSLKISSSDRASPCPRCGSTTTPWGPAIPWRSGNAVLIVHGTGGQRARASFGRSLPASCWVQGSSLDASRYFIVLPDALGHGKSSKPSDGLHARFPRYGYNDMVETEYRLLTEGFGVKHARLIMGTSMGCMHTWLLGEQHRGLHGCAHAAGVPADPISGAIACGASA